jgi:hypothetical protein
MYLRFARRRKDGKAHRYWSIVESRRCAGGRVVQRPVLYLGEINDGQREAWCRQIETFDEANGRHRQLALFPAERTVPDYAKGFGVQVRLDVAHGGARRRRNISSRGRRPKAVRAGYVSLDGELVGRLMCAAEHLRQMVGDVKTKFYAMHERIPPSK